jgi:endonuclease YncB( thermonuclease family)
MAFESLVHTASKLFDKIYSIVPHNIQLHLNSLFSRPIVPLILVLLSLYLVFAPTSEEMRLTKVDAKTASSPAKVGAMVTGTPYYIDADNLIIQDVHIRLYGVDAFEHGQSCQTSKGRTTNCGEFAKNTLISLVDGEDVTCQVISIDKFNRGIAKCMTKHRQDLNGALVNTGMALAHRKFSNDYVAIEEGARIAQVGAWAGFFTRPSSVRKTYQEDF